MTSKAAKALAGDTRGPSDVLEAKVGYCKATSNYVGSLVIGPGDCVHLHLSKKQVRAGKPLEHRKACGAHNHWNEPHIGKQTIWQRLTEKGRYQ